MPITEPIDEDELEADLAALEQENLDEKMLTTGTMPVADSLNRLPKAANGERKYPLYQRPPFPHRACATAKLFANMMKISKSQRQVESAGGRRGRGGGAAEAAGRDGHVKKISFDQAADYYHYYHYYYNVEINHPDCPKLFVCIIPIHTTLTMTSIFFFFLNLVLLEFNFILLSALIGPDPVAPYNGYRLLCLSGRPPEQSPGI